MTKNATFLIQPLLISAITENPVHVDTFDRKATEEISHISLAKEAILFVVAPATANMIGKMASGIAEPGPRGIDRLPFFVDLPHGYSSRYVLRWMDYRPIRIYIGER